MSPASNTCEVYCKLPECISHHDVLGNMVFAVEATKKSLYHSFPEIRVFLCSLQRDCI